MKNTNSKLEQIEHWLSQEEQGVVPPEIAESIMDEIKDRPLGVLPLLHSLYYKLYALRYYLPRPVQVLTSVLFLFCGMWLGSSFDRSPNTIGNIQDFSIVQSRIVPPSANHFWGRGLLAAGEVGQSIAFLQRAVELAPDIPEYRYWLGIAHWKAGDIESERESYLDSVTLQSNHLPTLVNLGHNYLENGEYNEALIYYDKALGLHSTNSNALYNRALALQLLGNDSGAKEAFRSYLHHNRSGRWARRAVEHLYRLGDFSYRSFVIGSEMVTVHLPGLLEDSGADNSEISRLTRILRKIDGAELHLVMYVEGDKKQAKEEVNKLKRELADSMNHTGLPIRTSWFDVPEKIKVPGGKTRYQERGLLIFTRFSETAVKRSTT